MTSPRPAIALALAIAVAAAAAPAEARRRSHPHHHKSTSPAGEKVRIESDPSGATVYLGDKDNGAAGQTPLELTLPPGDQVVILELAGYVDRFESVTVEDRKGAEADSTQTFAYAMTPATAPLHVQAAPGEHIPDGTRVKIDGNDAGPFPTSVAVEIGAHEVQVAAPGHVDYEEWVQVDGGDGATLSITAAELAGGGEVTAPAGPRRAHRDVPYGNLWTGVDVGWRSFRYQSPRTSNLLPYDGSGNAMFTIEGDFYPWRRFVTNRVLDHLSITGGAGYAPAIHASNNAGASVDAFWRSQHGGLRAVVGRPRLAAQIDASYTHTLYTFRDSKNMLVDQVPDVDYHIISLGAAVLAHLGRFDLWLGGDNCIVLRAGALATRFRDAKVDGVDARAGVAGWFLHHHLEARLDGSYQRLSWTFGSQAGDTYDADGGTDTFYGFTVSVGAAY